MNNLNVDDTIFKKLLIEIKRGDLVLAVLTQLENPDYGYSLLKNLKSAGMDVNQDTLYPLLRRLETQGFIQSHWDTQGSRPRKLYEIKPGCREVRNELINEWKKQKKIMEGIL